MDLASHKEAWSIKRLEQQRGSVGALHLHCFTVCIRSEIDDPLP